VTFDELTATDLDLSFEQFGTDVLISGVIKVRGIFDQPVKIPADFGQGVIVTSPGVCLKPADVATYDLQKDSLLLIAGTEYLIQTIHPDPSGFTQITLTRATT
jgi:hypothetical protein